MLPLFTVYVKTDIVKCTSQLIKLIRINFCFNPVARGFLKVICLFPNLKFYSFIYCLFVYTIYLLIHSLVKYLLNIYAHRVLYDRDDQYYL